MRSSTTTDTKMKSWEQHVCHVLALPVMQSITIPADKLKQIIREVAIGVYTEDTLPSVAIDFSHDGRLYPLLHPIYQHSLVGYAAGMVSYYLQAYVHGGMFNREIINNWNPDQEIKLQDHMISIKSFFHEKFPEVNYKSLFELLAINGLERIPGQEQTLEERFSIKYAKFKTVFNLSFAQLTSSVREIYDNTLVIEPNVKVTGEVELTPRYKSYLQEYESSTGHSPDDYQKLKNLITQLAKDIKIHLPKLCPEEFAILQVAQVACSYFEALKKMSKMPEFAPTERLAITSFPVLLPPIPVSYYNRYHVNICFRDICTKLSDDEYKIILKNILQQNDCSEEFLKKIKQIILDLVGNSIRLVAGGKAVELDDKEISTLCDIVKNHLHDLADNCKQKIQQFIENMQASRLIKNKSLDIQRITRAKTRSKKIELLREFVNQQFEEAKTKDKEGSEKWKTGTLKQIEQFVEELDNEIVANTMSFTKPWDRQFSGFHLILANDEYYAAHGDIHRAAIQCSLKACAMPKTRLQDGIYMAMHFQNAISDQSVENLIETTYKNKQYQVFSINVIPRVITHQLEYDALLHTLLPAKDRPQLTSEEVGQLQQFYKGEKIDIAPLLDKQDRDGQNILHYAGLWECTNTSIKTVLSLSPILLKQKDKHGYLPLHTAAAAGNDKAINLFLAKPIQKNISNSGQAENIDARNYNGYTPLMLACLQGKKTSVERLLALGSDPNLLLPNGLYAAHLALQNKHADTAMVILNHPRANINLATAEKATPLHVALDNGLEEIACQLVAKEADLDIERTSDGNNALAIAALSGADKALQAIIEKLDARKRAILAELHGHKQALESAIQQMEAQERKANSGSQFELLTVMASCALAVYSGGKFSLSPGMNIPGVVGLVGKLFSKDSGNSGSDISSLRTDLWRVNNAIEQIASTPITHNRPEFKCSSIIHVVAAYGYLEVVKKLVAYEKSNLDIQDEKHDTALMIALRYGQSQVSTYLAEQTALNLVNENNESASLRAAKTGQWAITDRLIDRGEDPTLRDKYGMNYVGILIIKGDFARYKQLAETKNIDGLMKFERNKRNYLSAGLALKHKHPMLATYIRSKYPSKIAISKNPDALCRAIIADNIDYYRENREAFLYRLPKHVNNNPVYAIGPDSVTHIVNPEHIDVIYVALAAEHASLRCLNEVLPLSISQDKSILPVVILAAIKGKNRTAIRSVLQHVTDLNVALDSDNYTAAHHAVRLGLLDLLPTLLEHGADYLAENTAGITPYHVALQVDDKDILIYLLKINNKDAWPDDLLGYAITQCANDCIELLMETCKRLTFTEKALKVQKVYEKALVPALENTNILVKLITLSQPSGKLLAELLHKAIEKQAFKIVELLLLQGADPSLMIEGVDAFILAVRNNHIRILHLFHKYGYAEHLPSYATRTTNVFTQEALNGNSTDLEGAKKQLLSAIDNRDIQSATKILENFPVNTVFLGQDDQPFLHLLLTLPLKVDEKEEAYLRFIGSVLRPVLSNIDPLMKNAKGNGLMFAPTTMDQHRRAMKVINHYFSAQKMAILTQTNSAGNTSLNNASQAMALFLIEEGYPLNHNASPMIVAMAAKGYVNAVKLLLDSGQSVDMINKEGRTALIAAAKCRMPHMVQYLLEECGAHPDLQDNNDASALHYAIENEDVNTALLLISAMSNIQLTDRHGQTPFMLSASANLPSVAIALSRDMTEFGTIDKFGYNALHSTTLSGATEIAKLIIDQGLPVDTEEGLTQDSDEKVLSKRSALHLAAWRNQVALFSELVKHGADIQKKDSRNVTPIDEANHKSPAMLPFLRQFHAFHERNQQKSLLLHAANHNALPLMRELLLASVPISTDDKLGSTALHYAMIGKAYEAAALLIQLGAPLDQANLDGNTPLHLAASNNLVKFIELMNGRVVDTNLQNTEGETPLYIACEKGYETAVLALVRLGADSTIASNTGMTATQVALHHGHIAIATLLTIFGDQSLFDSSVELLTLKGDSGGTLKATVARLQAVTDEAISKNWTPLHKAVVLASSLAVEAIVEFQPAMRDVVDAQGLNPQQLARQLNRLDVVALFDYLSKRKIAPIVVPVESLTIQTQPLLTEAELIVTMQTKLKQAQPSFGVKQLARICSQLSYEARSRFLEGFEKKSNVPYIASWITFLEINFGNPDFIKRIDTAILSKYSWDSIGDDTLMNAIKRVSNQSPGVQDWFFRFIEPIAVIRLDPKKLQSVISQWDAFLTRLLDPSLKSLLEQLSPPPQECISFHLESDYLHRATLVLKNVKNAIQLQHLNQLPSMSCLQQAIDADFQFITKQMVDKEVMKSYTLEDIESCVEYSSLKARILSFVPPRFYADTVKFFEALNQSGSLHQQERLIIGKCFANHIKNGYIDRDLVFRFVTAAVKLKQKLGDKLFIELLTLKNSMASINLYTVICEKAVALFQNDNKANTLIVEITNRLPDIDSVNQYVQEQYRSWYIKKLPVNDYASLKSRFLTHSDYVKFTLAETELDGYIDDYKKIVLHGESMHSLTPAELATIIAQNGDQLSKKSEDKEASLKLLAALREMILCHFGIYPHDTQMIVLLALVNCPKTNKGRIGQVRTGEGKSTIVAMLSAYLASQERIIDIITSSRNLAQRDQEKYADFFKSLNISSSYIGQDNPTAVNFDGQIIYGTNNDFEWSLQKEAIYEDTARHRNGKSRPADVALVDEADNLFLDTALHSARLTITSPHDRRWLYAPFYEFMIKLRDSEEDVQGSKAELEQKLLRRIRDMLNVYQNGIHREAVTQFTDEQLLDWCKSAFSAIERLQEDKDYTITIKHKDGKVSRNVTIVDYFNTGRKHTNTRWEKGMHEFVEVKHRLLPGNEILCVSSLSRPAFYNEYKTIYGLTGTSGEDKEREEIREIYNVDVFDAPPHNSPKRVRYPASYFVDHDRYKKAIQDNIESVTSQGRPVLVICETIKESELLAEQLKSQGIDSLLLNENQLAGEEYILWRAGQARAVTIATNTAGRGTDIILSKESKDNGGLHVIMTFFPCNERVEDQGMGRAGRQGQPGSCQLILSHDDRAIKSLISSNAKRIKLANDPCFLEKLNKLRTEDTNELSDYRIKHAKTENILHSLFKNFSGEFLPILRLQVRQINQDTMAEVCKGFTQQIHVEPDADVGKNWLMQGLWKRAYGMLMRQNNNEMVNWDFFLADCKEQYIKFITQKWALCYQYISDKRDKLDESEMRAYYQDFIREKIAPIQQNTVGSFQYFLMQVLSQARKVYLQKQNQQQEAQQTFENQQENLRIMQIEARALNGDHEAEFLLGNLFRERNDNINAYPWYVRAAAGGYQPAIDLLQTPDSTKNSENGEQIRPDSANSNTAADSYSVTIADKANPQSHKKWDVCIQDVTHEYLVYKQEKNKKKGFIDKNADYVVEPVEFGTGSAQKNLTTNKIKSSLVLSQSDLAKGNSLLHIAILTGSSTMLHELIRESDDINIANNRGKTALHIACEKGDYDSTLLLLKSHANRDIVDEDNFTPGELALKNGFIQLANLLFYSGDTNIFYGAFEKFPTLMKMTKAAYLAESPRIARHMQEELYPAVLLNDAKRAKGDNFECYLYPVFEDNQLDALSVLCARHVDDISRCHLVLRIAVNCNNVAAVRIILAHYNSLSLQYTHNTDELYGQMNIIDIAKTKGYADIVKLLEQALDKDIANENLASLLSIPVHHATKSSSFLEKLAYASATTSASQASKSKVSCDNSSFASQVAIKPVTTSPASSSTADADVSKGVYPNSLFSSPASLPNSNTASVESEIQNFLNTVTPRYLRDMQDATPGVALWGGDIEMDALCRLKAAYVTIHRNGTISSVGDKSSSNKIHLLYNGVHYTVCDSSGKEVRKISPDGNCLFASFLTALNMLRGDNTSISQTEIQNIRVNVSDIMRKDYDAIMRGDRITPVGYKGSVRLNNENNTIRSRFNSIFLADTHAQLQEAISILPVSSLRNEAVKLREKLIACRVQEHSGISNRASFVA